MLFFFDHPVSGEVKVDQAHRGYTLATDASGYASSNPLFMKYAPSNGCVPCLERNFVAWLACLVTHYASLSLFAIVSLGAVIMIDHTYEHIISYSW